MSSGHSHSSGSSSTLPPPPQLPSSSTSSVQQLLDIVMAGAATSPLPSTSSSQQQSPNAATTSTPSSTSSTTAGSSAGSATPATTTTGAVTRNKRQELSFAERIQVILARKSGKSMRQLAVQFGCGKTQILNILGQRESYLREWDEKQAESNPHISSRKRRSRRTGNEETNRLVWDWYNAQRDLGIRVTGPMLQREARSIARTLGISNFAASNGWLDSFRRLHNIGPQSRGAAQQQERRTTSAGGNVQQGSSSTPEPTCSVASSSYSAPEFGYTQNPTSSGDALSPETTSSTSHSLPPPPPLEVFDYPHGRFPEDQRSSEDVEFDSSESVQRIVTEPEAGFKHFASMATVFQVPAAHPSDADRRMQPQHVAMDEDQRYSRHYDRVQHPSSSSNNSLVFSPTSEVYPPLGNNNGNGSRPLDPMDCRQPSTLFQQVPGHLYAPPHPSTVEHQQPGTSRLLIQDVRTVGISEPMSQQQQQQRRSVLVSTRSAAAEAAAAAAAAAVAAAAFENQNLVLDPGAAEKRRSFAIASSGSSSSPGLEPIPGLFSDLISMVRSNELSGIEYADDRGELWLEVRPPSSAAFRVPFYGYRTHLMRLIIDRHLSYWLEVLGHCVRSGTFRSLTSGGIDPNLVKPLFDLLNGGATVCHGRGSVLKRVHQFHPKLALEQGLAARNYFTLPDYRYRSYECLRLIDTRSGATQCVACLRAPEPSLSPLPEGIQTSPARRLQRQQQQQTNLQQQHHHQEQEQPKQQQQHQQQHHQQHAMHPSYPPSEPLNLSVHHSMVIPSSVPNQPPAALGFLPTTIYTGNQRLQVEASTVPANATQQHHHHHHHHYRCGSAGSDQNPDDYRLAKEAAYLSLTNERDRSRNSCCKDWHVSGENCSTDMSNGVKRTSLSPPRNHVEDVSYDPDFHATWIKQETLGSPNNSAG